MSIKVVLDRQHKGKPNSADQGAVFADGTTEAAHAERYIGVAVPLLRASGIDVVVLTTGSYSTRQARANELRADLYVACHVNAGGGEYALTEYASDRGVPATSQRAARELLRASDDELDEKAVGPKPLRSGERGHTCVAGAHMPAVIYEPYFTNAARDDALVGRCLAQGICNFFGVALRTKPQEDEVLESTGQEILTELRNIKTELSTGDKGPVGGVIADMSARMRRQGFDLGWLKEVATDIAAKVGVTLRRPAP